MTKESAAHNDADGPPTASEPASVDSSTSDVALLEEALQEAIDAHEAGLLAAPFGVDAVALARARRRAALADQRRQIERQPGDSHPDSTC